MTTSVARGRTASLHERALLCAAQGGDRRAQEELLGRYEPLVRHTVSRLPLPCRCEAADFAQEARLALLRAIRAWQPGRGPFPAFAAHCVRTKTANALDSARALKHQPLSRALSLDWLAPSGAAPGLPPTHPSSPRWENPVASRDEPRGGTDPVGALLIREQLAAVRAAWPTLTAKQREVLAAVLNGKSHRQIAAELDCTAKGVGRVLRRARRNLAAAEVLVA